MPIDRNGKHWCNPAAETPDENGVWTCPGCGNVWTFDASRSLWSPAEDIETAGPPASDAVPAPAAARRRKGGGK